MNRNRLSAVRVACSVLYVGNVNRDRFWRQAAPDEDFTIRDPLFAELDDLRQARASSVLLHEEEPAVAGAVAEKAPRRVSVVFGFMISRGPGGYIAVGREVPDLDGRGWREVIL